MGFLLFANALHSLQVDYCNNKAIRLNQHSIVTSKNVYEEVTPIILIIMMVKIHVHIVWLTEVHVIQLVNIQRNCSLKERLYNKQLHSVNRNKNKHLKPSAVQ